MGARRTHPARPDLSRAPAISAPAEVTRVRFLLAVVLFVEGDGLAHGQRPGLWREFDLAMR